MSSIQWLEWADETFESAEEQHKPVLLFITSSWCRWCRTMEQETFSSSEVVERIEKSFIPIHVDADKRPDINARYNLGGWPTTAFLTPGGEVITGGTFFHAQELSLLLEKIAHGK